jgi:beta-glucosidase
MSAHVHSRVADPAAGDRSPFPPGFLWGAATASHQVEGGNRWNDWWELEERGRLPHRSGEACRHFELYESDFDLAQSMGHNAHRFSIEWSRIEPRRGEWDPGALDHYVAVVDALRKRGIEPIVTLHHFTNPAWFAHAGGWTAAASAGMFSRYVKRVAATLSSRVRYWLTINEPTVYVKHAYVMGDWPPLVQKSWGGAAVAMRNMARAHSAAYDILHRARADSMVGFAHSAPYVVPCDASSVADRMAARLRDLALNHAFFRLIGQTPCDALDFIGLNFYARQVVRWRPSLGAAMLFGHECRDDHHGTPRTFSPLGWEYFAPGLHEALRLFQRYAVPLMVTENGIATLDEQLRSRYVADHIDALGLAVRDGVPVLGYLYWTLMDNYEWVEGRGARFGLAAVDFATQDRTVRPAAQVMAAKFQTR